MYVSDKGYWQLISQRSLIQRQQSLQLYRIWLFKGETVYIKLAADLAPTTQVGDKVVIVSNASADTYLLMVCRQQLKMVKIAVLYSRLDSR